MEDLSVLSLELFFLIEASLKKARKCVCYCICFTLTIIDLKIVIIDLLGPTNLIKAQILYIYKLLKVIIVNKNEELAFVV